MKNITKIDGGSVGAALLEGIRRLSECDVLRPRRHTELLLESALCVDRTQLYLNAREPMTLQQTEVYNRLLERRESGEPVQYITGWAAFFGRGFLVGEGVFIPRFDSEVIVERVTELVSGEADILDICCGCGAIGLSLAAELPGSKVVLTDISETALEYSARNAVKLLVNNRIDLVKWDALGDPPSDWRGRFDFVTANPPYIPVDDIPKLHRDVRDGEPHEALTDGGDGLSFYRKWAKTLPQILKPDGKLLVEAGDGAARSVKSILAASFDDLTTLKDLTGVDRVVEGIPIPQSGDNRNPASDLK